MYESAYAAQLWQLYETNTHHYLASGDYNPSQYQIKVEKGDYTVRLQVRGEKKEMLEKFCGNGGNNELLPLVIWFKLVGSGSGLSLDCYKSLYELQMAGCVGGKKKVGSGSGSSGNGIAD